MRILASGAALGKRGKSPNRSLNGDRRGNAMKVRHILESKGTEVYQVSPEESVTAAVGRMMEHKSGSLLVMEKGQLTGIITERDVLRAVNRYGAELDALMVREVMATDVVFCRDTDTLDEAMALRIENPSEHAIRHLTVIEGERGRGGGGDGGGRAARRDDLHARHRAGATHRDKV
mgnify:CR=1 FL=1